MTSTNTHRCPTQEQSCTEVGMRRIECPVICWLFQSTFSFSFSFHHLHIHSKNNDSLCFVFVLSITKDNIAGPPKTIGIALNIKKPECLYLNDNGFSPSNLPPMLAQCWREVKWYEIRWSIYQVSLFKTVWKYLNKFAKHHCRSFDTLQVH